MEARPLDDERWELTVVGFDRIGDLSVICGLLFTFGYNIESGDVFTCLEGTLVEENVKAVRDLAGTQIRRRLHRPADADRRSPRRLETV